MPLNLAKPSNAMSIFQWRSQGRGLPLQILAVPCQLKLKDRDTLIEQSYILVKQSVGQVLMEHNGPQWSIIGKILEQCSKA